jgi:maleylpyruvate isomerase
MDSVNDGKQKQPEDLREVFDEAARLFPQQRVLPGPNRVEPEGAERRASGPSLRKGEQCAPQYLAINPQGLVPALQDDAGEILTQSLAIIEWLDETHPEPPLLPKDPLRRAKVRAFAMALACDTHPVQNLKVLARLRELGLPEDQVTGWAAWANREGLGACETLIAHEPGPFCFGAQPTIADLCLVPQLANARRFGVDLQAFPRLLRAEAATRGIQAFADAAPDRQPDAE